MRKSIVLLIIASLPVLFFCGSDALAQSVCSAHAQAVGFMSEKGLVDFIVKAKAGPKEVKQYLSELISKNQAVILKGDQKVHIILRAKGNDPSIDKVKVRTVGKNQVLWVPGGALNCE